MGPFRRTQLFARYKAPDARSKPAHNTLLVALAADLVNRLAFISTTVKLRVNRGAGIPALLRAAER